MTVSLEQPALFGDPMPADISVEPAIADRRRELGQFFTPAWACEAIIERYFPDLDAGKDVVLEPSCGPGRFLAAIPCEIPAVGVEIDHELAVQARALTGRRVIEGDFRTVPIDVAPTAIIGNPPYDLDLITAFLDRAYRLLPENGRLGFLLPAYAFQTASRVCAYATRWSIRQESVPRNIFDGLSMPLTFSIFSKQRERVLIGFALYHETASVHALSNRYRRLLENPPPGGIWSAVVRTALRELGGTGTVAQVIRLVEGRRPTATAFWREKVRQTLQRICVRVAPATYALSPAG